MDNFNYINESTENLLDDNILDEERDLQKLAKLVRRKVKANSSKLVKLITGGTPLYERLDKKPTGVEYLADLMAQYASLSSYVVQIPQVYLSENLYNNQETLVLHTEEEVKKELARVETYRKKLAEEQKEFIFNFDKQKNELEMLLNRLNGCSSKVIDIDLFEKFEKEKQSAIYDSLLADLRREVDERSKLQKKVIKSKRVRGTIAYLNREIYNDQKFMYSQMIGKMLDSLNFRVNVPQNFEGLNLDLLFKEQRTWYHFRDIESTKFVSDLMYTLEVIFQDKFSEKIIAKKIKIIAEFRNSMGLSISKRKIVNNMQAWDDSVSSGIYSLKKEENVSTIIDQVENLKNIANDKANRDFLVEKNPKKSKVKIKKLHIL